MSALALRSKSLYSDADEQLALADAMKYAWNLAVPCPVEYAGKIVGQVGYDPRTKSVWCGPVSGRDQIEAVASSFDNMVAIATGAVPKMHQIYLQKFDYNNLIAGNSWIDNWSLGSAEAPGGTYPGSASTAYVADPTTDPGIPAVGPPLLAGESRTLVGADAATIGGPNSFMVYDRILTYNSCPLYNGTTTMTNTVTPTRGRGGLGVQLMLTTQVYFTGVNLVSFSFVGSDSNTYTTTIPSGKGNLYNTNTASLTVPAVVAPGTLSPAMAPFMAIQPSGIYQLTNYVCDATTAGYICWVLAQPVVIMSSRQLNRCITKDVLRQCPAMVSIPDDACLSIISSSGYDAGENKTNLGVVLTVLRG